ncbi:hypothetical protein CKO12_09075 [Chromatium okenii]|uniref:DUF2868 domain-containing protein n=1 Tax=Chromatium okenii TaxID=61644 RepID=UPI001906480B|nr:DUF2868 domain-containing protein [Chromatium okenii]MBK1642021.1 hypothetical protein [Chromatium okenii]
MKFPRFSALLQRSEVRRADWTSSDLIDFENYLAEDDAQLREQPAARKTLAQRDRVLYIEHIAPELAPVKAQPHTTAHRRLSLRRWLTARRNAEDPQLTPLLPGAAFDSAQRLGTVALAGGGLLLGVGLASALLSYDGRLPISVSNYVLVLVLVQLLFVVTAIWAWLRQSLRRDAATAPSSGLLALVLQPLLTRAAQWLQRQRLTATTADVRERVLARHGLLQAQFTIYGSVAYFPLLIPAQVFGVAFNVGVIGTTILLEWFTDLAFGWSTSLIAHPQTIHDLAHAIALPWSGIFGEGVGYPTLAQIEGSRIYLEQWANATPAFHPNPEHLRSWRWFLVLAVFTYGLLPRLILLGLSVLMQRLALARLTFTHGRSQALYARMLTPLVETTAAVMVPGVEMPIPAPLTPHSRRAGLIGPLTGEKPPPSVRPWREKVPVIVPQPPIDQSSQPLLAPPLEKGGLGGIEAVPAIAPEPIVELKDAPQLPIDKSPQPPFSKGGLLIAPEPIVELPTAPEPVIEIAPEPIVELPTAPEPVIEIAPEPIVELPTAPEPIIEIAPEPVVELPTAPEPVIEIAPEPIVELPTAPEPVIEIAPQPIVELPAAPEPIIEIAPEPIVELPAAPEPVIEIELPLAPPLEKEELRGSDEATHFSPDACLLLVHVDVDDVLEPEDRPRLEQLLLQLTGWRIGAYATVGAGSAMTMKALELLDGGIWDAPPPRIALIQDGSQPPITENLLLLRDLRAAAGTQAQMLLALVGDPQDDDRLPPLRAFDYTDWQRKVDQMADPYLRLEMLAPPSDGED